MHAATASAHAPGGDQGRRRGGQGGQAWPVGVGADRGDRGGARVGQLAEGDWEDWGRARARATVAGETRSRQFAVGHGRAERSRGRSPWRGASRGIDQLAVGQNGPPGPASTPNGAPRRDRGTSGRVARGPAAGGWTAVSEQYISCPGASTSTCVYIYIYICMYVCIDRSIDAPSPPSTAGPRRTGLDVYISPRVRCCTASRQVQISPDIRPWPAVLVTGTPSLRWGRPSRGQAPPPSLT